MHLMTRALACAKMSWFISDAKTHINFISTDSSQCQDLASVCWLWHIPKLPNIDILAQQEVLVSATIHLTILKAKLVN